MLQELQNSYGQQFEELLINAITQEGALKEVPAGYKFMEVRDHIKGMPLILSGAIKILRDDNDGDELLLYYLEPGDTCSMTMKCCLGNATSEIRAIAETDTKLIIIPVQKMDAWIVKYRSWRSFVFESYQNRLNELLTTLDSIAFNNMDERLITYLKEKARIQLQNEVRNTHQEIAYELHSSRVVISRLLKKLEQLGKIELYRNYIKLIDL